MISYTQRGYSFFIMPIKPQRACAESGCPNAALPGSSRCAQHHRERKREADTRLSAAQRGYDHKWRMTRARFIKEHPLCICGEKATDVDHIIPRSQGGTDEWCNLQALCHSCHSRKTDKYDGGWGR
ncbi:MAG: HNH endonuclease [Phage 5P_3]|nr:MAG: HNH endonuclease [Phage 5P_3]